jgi:hypothetical protein
MGAHAPDKEKYMKRIAKSGINGGRPIDFVLLWVDGADPAWQKEKQKWASADPETDARPQRFREWGILPYWFRGVEAFAPWVRKVHFVTWGHLPPWLNKDHPKLHIVNHRDYMPADALPTFNSRALELNLHRIPGLSEQFVYFNDDVLLIRDTVPEDFFIGGLPRDMLALQPVGANPMNPVMSYSYLNESLAISRHFTKHERMRAMPGKYFRVGYPPKYFFYNLLETLFPMYTGFYTVHGPSPLLKSTYEEVWKLEGPLLMETTRSRFRTRNDVSQYILREWQKQTGRFVPANLLRDFQYIIVTDTSDKSLDVIRKQKKKTVCLNDSDYLIDFENTRKVWVEALDSILHSPSAFER